MSAASLLVSYLVVIPDTIWQFEIAPNLTAFEICSLAVADPRRFSTDLLNSMLYQWKDRRIKSLQRRLTAPHLGTDEKHDLALEAIKVYRWQFCQCLEKWYVHGMKTVLQLFDSIIKYGFNDSVGEEYQVYLLKLWRTYRIANNKSILSSMRQADDVEKARAMRDKESINENMYPLRYNVLERLLNEQALLHCPDRRHFFVSLLNQHKRALILLAGWCERCPGDSAGKVRDLCCRRLFSYFQTTPTLTEADIKAFVYAAYYSRGNEASGISTSIEFISLLIRREEYVLFDKFCKTITPERLFYIISSRPYNKSLLQLIKRHHKAELILHRRSKDIGSLLNTTKVRSFGSKKKFFKSNVFGNYAYSKL